MNNSKKFNFISVIISLLYIAFIFNSLRKEIVVPFWDYYGHTITNIFLVVFIIIIFWGIYLYVKRIITVFFLKNDTDINSLGAKISFALSTIVILYTLKISMSFFYQHLGEYSTAMGVSLIFFYYNPYCRINDFQKNRENKIIKIGFWVSNILTLLWIFLFHNFFNSSEAFLLRVQLGFESIEYFVILAVGVFIIYYFSYLIFVYVDEKRKTSLSTHSFHISWTDIFRRTFKY